MDIASQIRRVARGKHGSEHLTRQEAAAVLSALLEPGADELQLGAFLIAQRMKGETSAELAGFVDAARGRMAGFGVVTAPVCAVDYPCYAGKRRAPHAGLAAALRARDAGIPVFVHGVAEIDGRVSAWQLLRAAGVARVETLADAAAALQREGIVYVDLADICPDLYRIYMLRPRLGVRSFANTVARLLNPMQCAGQLNGFFHTPYADYMAQANRLLGQEHSLLFMGAEGEPELYADRQKLVLMQQREQLMQISYDPAGLDPYPRQAMDLMLLQDRFAAMLDGEANACEAAAMARMGEAFSWAATGRMPASWRQIASEEE